MRIILIRHGRPAISTRQRTGHKGFRDYIDAYEASGLASDSFPPDAVCELVRGLKAIYTSGKPRAQDSARKLAPDAKLINDPLFVEAPLASPFIPLVHLGVASWAVVSRILWHFGYHPDMENYRASKRRAAKAADILIRTAKTNGGTAAVVAHGYFNAILGRELARRGYERTGSHRVRYWNAVVYEIDI